MGWVLATFFAVLLAGVVVRGKQFGLKNRWKFGRKSDQEKIDDVIGPNSEPADPVIKKVNQLVIDALETLSEHERRLRRLEDERGDTWKKGRG